MPLFGAHLSVAGGLHKAPLAARERGMDTVQIFTASPQSWPVPPTPGGQVVRPVEGTGLDAAAVRLFRRTLRQTRLRQPMAHDCYLINLASPDPALFRRSVEAFVLELR